ncbi:MAG: hypothetical protein AAF654_12545 [Myxococcota bacterium]
MSSTAPASAATAAGPKSDRAVTAVHTARALLNVLIDPKHLSIGHACEAVQGNFKRTTVLKALHPDSRGAGLSAKEAQLCDRALAFYLVSDARADSGFEKAYSQFLECAPASARNKASPNPPKAPRPPRTSTAWTTQDMHSDPDMSWSAFKEDGPRVYDGRRLRSGAICAGLSFAGGIYGYVNGSEGALLTGAMIALAFIAVTLDPSKKVSADSK